jgi:hypothetical protein
MRRVRRERLDAGLGVSLRCSTNIEEGARG